MGLFKNFVSQTRKPEGFLGQMMVNGMNSGHAKMADWGMAHLKTIAPEEILEVGCGGGRNAHELLQKYPSSKVTAIDYSDVSVAKAAAFETIYFWPGLEKCFSEVNKALKPGGVFMIVNESDGTDKASLQFESIIDGMKCHTVEEIEGALKEAGFSKVKSDHHESKPWITVIAKK